MSTYEELQLIISAVSLIVSTFSLIVTILTYTHKK